jgi:hypothetical protein
MVEHPDIHPPPDDQPDVDKFAALVDAPVTALGLSSSDADALEQALDVKTVRDLADNKYGSSPASVGLEVVSMPVSPA